MEEPDMIHRSTETVCENYCYDSSKLLRNYYLQGLNKSTGTRTQQSTNPAKGKEVKESKDPPKKKLFLTDGWQVPCTGICIYMFR